MKTIIIWNHCNFGLNYTVLDGDYSRWDKVLLGGTEEDKELQDELAEFIKTNELILKSDFPNYVFDQEFSENIKIIECGMNDYYRNLESI